MVLSTMRNCKFTAPSNVRRLNYATGKAKAKAYHFLISYDSRKDPWSLNNSLGEINILSCLTALLTVGSGNNNLKISSKGFKKKNEIKIGMTAKK